MSCVNLRMLHSQKKIIQITTNVIKWQSTYPSLPIEQAWFLLNLKLASVAEI